jgi:hypothetical protein
MTAVHTLIIPNWHPATLNSWDGRHWSVRARAKRIDRELLGWHARAAGIPPAKGKRRVSLVIVLAPRQRGGDPDCYWKSLLDSLVAAGLLTDDNRLGCELGTVRFVRGPRRQTEIRLRDVRGASP